MTSPKATDWKKISKQAQFGWFFVIFIIITSHHTQLFIYLVLFVIFVSYQIVSLWTHRGLICWIILVPVLIIESNLNDQITDGTNCSFGAVCKGICIHWGWNINLGTNHSEQSGSSHGSIELEARQDRRKPTSTGKSICPNGCTDHFRFTT